MELNLTLFNKESGSSNGTNSTETDTEATTHPFLPYMILFDLPLVGLLVVVPALVVIIIILKSRKQREKNNNIFYVNLLFTDVVTVLSRCIVTSIIIICYLLDAPNVSCKIILVPLNTTTFGSRLMFLPVIIDRFLHVAFPFSYKSIITTKRIILSISGIWLMTLVFGIFTAVKQDCILLPEYGTCIRKDASNNSFPLLIASVLLTVPLCIITGICIYLHYKIVHSNRFFNSVKRNSTEERKALKIGMLVEVLQEQVRPTFSVFIAGGIDAAFTGLAFVFLSLMARGINLELSTGGLLMVFIQFCQYFSHAVVYGIRVTYIRKEIIEIFRKITGPKKSKVIMLNGQ